MTRWQYLQTFPDGTKLQISHPQYQFTCQCVDGHKLLLRWEPRIDPKGAGTKTLGLPTPSRACQQWVESVMHLALADPLPPPPIDPALQ